MLGIISHISHPHPQIPPLHLSAPFKGILLLSPWVSFGSVSSSGERCKNRDIIQPEIARKWSNAFLGEQKTDEYNEPLSAKVAWWKGLKAEEILLVASADECLTDDVAKMGGILKVSHVTFSSSFHPLWQAYLLGSVCFCARGLWLNPRRRNDKSIHPQSAHPNATTILVEGEYHDQPIFGKESDQGVIITSWVLSHMGISPLEDHHSKVTKGLLNVRSKKE